MNIVLNHFTFLALRCQSAHKFISDPEDLDKTWPPKDPNALPVPEDDPNYVFKLPDSPWTFADGSLNPALRAANSASAATTIRKRKGKKEVVLSVPPYHPDYGKNQTQDASDASSWDDSSSEGDVHDDKADDGYEYSQTSSGLGQRRGSEGYEVRPINREALLIQHVVETTGELGRYNFYVPGRDGGETSSEEEPELVDEEEDMVGDADAGKL